MRAVFQQELKEVQTRLIELAGGAQTIMKKASNAFLNSDVALADEALALADSNEEKALDLDELVIADPPSSRRPTSSDKKASKVTGEARLFFVIRAAATSKMRACTGS